MNKFYMEYRADYKKTGNNLYSTIQDKYRPTNYETDSKLKYDCIWQKWQSIEDKYFGDISRNWMRAAMLYVYCWPYNHGSLGFNSKGLHLQQAKPLDLMCT